MKDKLYLSDLGNGTYQNPVLLCDYSDPDAIRVGDTYYLTASTFNYAPGLPILVSHDLVNWTLKNYALPNGPDYTGKVPQHAKGVWAPAIRYHDGWFYIFYGMPDEGIFCVRTRDALGAWEKPVLVLGGKGLIDSCPFWDDDGSAWVIHGYAKSRIGFKSVLGIFPMNPNTLKACGPDRILFDGQVTQPTIEGPKVYKRDGWYYIFAPAGGVPTGWQVVLRSRSLRGPWEEKVALKQGSSPVNGPHQGAWVDAPDGTDWFLHFQSRGLYGRIVHLQPMGWQEDGWPWMGREDPSPVPAENIATGEDARAAALVANAADCGIPVMTWQKPAGPACEPASEQASDDFMGDSLALQWQFMGSNEERFYELRRGKLALKACELPEETGTHERLLWECPQALTQKVACLNFTARTAFDARGLKDGEEAGLALIGGQYAFLAARREAGALKMVYVESEADAAAPCGKREVVKASVDCPEQAEVRIVLRNTGYAEAEADFAWRVPGGEWQTLGTGFSPSRHTWVGARLGLFCMPMAAVNAVPGEAVFAPFEVVPEVEA